MDLLTRLSSIVAEGFHGAYLLIFTAVIWLVFAQILLADRRNRSNIWCFFTGMVFSVGTFKEYLFYELGPVLAARGCVSPGASELGYSLLSAVFYYLAMPCALVFGLYYSHAEQEIPKLFPRHKYLCYLPALLMAALFPWTQTHALQAEPLFCLSVAVYEWLYGILLTALLLRTLRRSRQTVHYRQQSLVAFSVLLPLWCWLIAAFPYHALGVQSLVKAWQLNLLMLVFVLLFLLFHTFREGIWGMRFKREAYDWSSGEKVLQKNAAFISHALKNDLAKIDWCVELMQQRGAQDKELEIIKRSSEHLESFIRHTKLYSDKIELSCASCDVSQLLHGLQEGFAAAEGKRITVEITACDPQPLNCDGTQVEEVLRNLIGNAEDAIAENGVIRLAYQVLKRGKRAVITVADDGCGME